MATISAPSPGAARTIPAWRRALQTAINWIVLAVIVVGVGYFLRARAHQQVTPVAGADVPAATLSENLPDTLMLPPETVEAMHVQAVQDAERAVGIPVHDLRRVDDAEPQPGRCGRRCDHAEGENAGQCAQPS